MDDVIGKRTYYYRCPVCTSQIICFLEDVSEIELGVSVKYATSGTLRHVNTPVSEPCAMAVGILRDELNRSLTSTLEASLAFMRSNVEEWNDVSNRQDWGNAQARQQLNDTVKFYKQIMEERKS